MLIHWFGQSAFSLTAGLTVLLDPFRIDEQPEPGKKRFDYPPIVGVEPDLVLVTHEHSDHNAVEVACGSPQIIRSTAGTFDSPIGEVVAVTSEHDALAGTRKGRNTIFRFKLGGLHFCHLGDLGQPGLRPEQQQAVGEIDVLFVPVGGGSTIGGNAAVNVVRALHPRLVVPMHYRTAALDTLEPPDDFLAALAAPVERIAAVAFEPEPLFGTPDRPTVAMPTAPVRS